jgi:hypothetical protein
MPRCSQLVQPLAQSCTQLAQSLVQLCYQQQSSAPSVAVLELLLPHLLLLLH